MRRKRGNKFLSISAVVAWGFVIWSGNIGLIAGLPLGPVAATFEFRLTNLRPLRPVSVIVFSRVDCVALAKFLTVVR